MPQLSFLLAKQVGRVPSMTLALDRQQEARFQKLMEEVIMVDLHEHPMVLPEDMNNLVEYLRVGEYDWGYEAAEHGGWAAVATANCFRGMAKNRELSYISFEDLADEVGMMVAHMGQHKDSVVKVTTADEILKAKADGKVSFMPTVEHMALGDQIQRVDTLYALGVRIAGLTYNLQNNIGSGLTERHDAGLTKFGVDVVHRMNDLGMAVDVSHAGMQTAMDAIEHSKAPILFSHNAAYTLRPTWRTRKDEELAACAKKGGLVAITAVPNSLSDDPKQNINVVLDHYDYLVKLLGIDHVAIGTDTLIGDHVAYHKLMLPGMLRKYPVPYLDGLESPADGKNLIRGFILRGYDDAQIKKLAGENALNFLRRTVG